MGKVHYFQRYSNKENVITNNTLLLFSRINSFKEGYLEAFLSEIAEEIEIPVGIKIEQQKGTKSSIPDGIINQDSFKIVIETKRGSRFSFSQLKNHLNKFNNENIKILFVITSSEASLEKKEKAEKNMSDSDVNLIFTTFREIISAGKNTIDVHDFNLKEILEDYEEFCYDSNLLPRNKFRMRAIACSKSFKENMKYALYYEPSSRGTRKHQYIGIYNNKAIRGIGKIAKEVIIKSLNNDTVKVLNEEKLTDDEEKRILEAAKTASEKRGWNISNHKIYLADELYKTNFKKMSPGGLRHTKYFDLGEELEVDSLPSTKKIAKQLRDKEWK